MSRSTSTNFVDWTSPREMDLGRSPNEHLYTGQTLPGYRLDEAVEQIGDEIERVVRWKQGASVESIAGRPVRLRFVLRDADLFSIRFR